MIRVFFKRNMKMHDNHEKVEEKKLCCQYCRRKYKSLKTLRNHENSHKYKFCCKLCSKQFQTAEDKEEHINKKHKNKTKIRKCRICPDTIFNSEEDYLLHTDEVHKGKYLDYYMCSDCGKQFKTKSELTSHITSKCGTVKQFKCQVCGQELMTAGSLHNHMLRHNGEPSFMCRFCAKLFLTAGQLKVHERIHTQDKAFVCQVCGKGFCHRQSLITHSTLHTGIKPYQCENCGNSFSCVGNLLKHRKTHADSCGLIPLTTHRVKHPATRMKVKVNTPANSKLKQMRKEKELQDKLNAFKERKLEQEKVLIETDESCKQIISLDENDVIASDCLSNHNDDLLSIRKEIVVEKTDELNMQDTFNLDADILLNEKTNYTEYKNKEDLKVEETKLTNENNVDLSKYENSINIVSLSINNDSLDSDNGKDIINEIDLENARENLDLHTNPNISSPEKIKRKSARHNGNSLKITKQELEEFVKNRKIQNKEDIVCKFCNKTYSNAKWLYRHEKLHHEKDESSKEENVEDVFRCNCCEASFSTREERKTHQKTVHADMLTCQDCDKIFSNMVSLRIHKNNFHKGLPRKVYIYVCERCGRQFKQKASLVYHEENNCGSGPLIQCNICGKNFSSIHVRKSHMRVHDTEKKLLCKFCGKSFHWKGQLKIHERSHTGEKPFSCLYCPKAFAYRESLITHSSLHTGIKPHLCEACGSRFSCIGNLIKHRGTHVNTCGIWYSKNKT